MIKLYYHPKTRAARVRWALEELGTSYDLVNINLTQGEQKSPNYLKVHPLGVVPAIQDEDLTLFESGAIVSYLADEYGTDTLCPSVDAPERAHYYQWMFFAIATLETPIVQVFQQSKLADDKKLPQVLADATANFNKSATYLSDYLKNKNFMVGKTFTAADILTASCLIFADSLGMLTNFPVLQKYAKTMSDRPAYKKATA